MQSRKTEHRKKSQIRRIEMKKKPVQYLDWGDVNEAVRRFGEIDIAIGRLEGELTLKTNDLKSEYEGKAQALALERKGIEEAVEGFCEEHKEEFAKKRSRELVFGTVAYKVATKIVIKTVKSCISAMEALGLDSYMKIKKTPDKEKMLGLDDQTLAKIGARKSTQDKLRIEPNMERIGKEALGAA
jgi:phage host-nuclease inhibitor protein Gam